MERDGHVCLADLFRRQSAERKKRFDGHVAIRLTGIVGGTHGELGTVRCQKCTASDDCARDDRRQNRSVQYFTQSGSMLRLWFGCDRRLYEEPSLDLCFYVSKSRFFLLVRYKSRTLESLG